MLCMNRIASVAAVETGRMFLSLASGSGLINGSLRLSVCPVSQEPFNLSRRLTDELSCRARTGTRNSVNVIATLQGFFCKTAIVCPLGTLEETLNLSLSSWLIGS